MLAPPPARSRDVPWIAVAVLALELALAGRYGIFRDEMYYVACGRHLAFGYVDHPPLVAVMAWLSCALLGGSVRALRVIPALLAAASVWSAGEMARELGGGRFAQALAAVCVAVAPEVLGSCHILSMNCVLPVAWTWAALFATRAVARGQARAWAGFGVACGIGLLAKHSTLFFGVGLAVGLLATPARRVLRTAGPWLGLGIAALMISPNLAWEQLHGWPTLEFMHNAQTQKMAHQSALSFVGAQIADMLPLTLPVWLGGTLWLLFARAARPASFLGVAFVVVYAIVMFGDGKPYYVAPAFPLAFAAGGVAFEAWVARPVSRAAILGVLVAAGAAIAPMAVPVLDEPAFIRYAASLGARPRERREARDGRIAAVPGRPARLGGDGDARRARLPEPDARRAARRHHLRRQLRRGRRGGLLRPSLGPAARLEWPQRVLHVGPAAAGSRRRDARHRRLRVQRLEQRLRAHRRGQPDGRPVRHAVREPRSRVRPARAQGAARAGLAATPALHLRRARIASSRARPAPLFPRDDSRPVPRYSIGPPVSDLTIAPNSHAVVDYELRVEDDELVDSSEGEDGEPLSYVHGYGMLVPGLEAALEGMKAGDERESSFRPRRGTASATSRSCCACDRSELPDEGKVEVGDELVAESPDGDEIAMIVVEIDGDEVVVDADHPWPA